MEIFEAYTSKSKTVLYLLGCLMFVAGGVWLITGDIDDRQAVVAGWGSAMFFGLGALVFIWRLLQNDVVIRIDDKSIYFKNMSPDPIPFSDLSGIEHKIISVAMSEQDYAILLIEPDKEGTLNFNKTYRMTAKLNKSFGFRGPSVMTVGLNRSFDEMWDNLIARFEAYNEKVGR